MVSIVDIIQRFSYGFRRWSFMVSAIPGNCFSWFPSSIFFFMVSVVAGKHFFMVSVAGFLVDSAAAGGSNILECIERFLVFFSVFRTGFRRCFLFYSFRRGRKTIFIVSVVGLFVGFRRGRERFLMVSVVGFFLLMVSGCYRTAAVSPMETVKTNHQDVSVTN